MTPEPASPATPGSGSAGRHGPPDEPQAMHNYAEQIEVLANAIVEHARWRTRLDPIPLDHPRTEADLRAACGPTVTPDGIGGQEALRLFTEVLGPSCLSIDHPRYLSFVPSAPTEVAVLFDLVVGAYSIFGGSWLEGSGAVHAENEALRWLTGLCGWPASSGGVFVQGGTIGNLSALVAARGAAEGRLAGRGRPRPDRWVFVTSATAHSSVASAAKVMDADVVVVDTDADRRLRGPAVEAALDRHGDRVAGVVATAGSTNLGVIDDLATIGEVCQRREVHLHVDGAYGGAAMAVPELRPAFAGIELADSVIVDPHKWLFAPFDCCALLWRHPEQARAVHAQHAGYLDFLSAYGDWNPSDYAIHLTRRARGLPFWFSLATHGTDAYAAAIRSTVAVAAEAGRMVEAASHLRLAFPQRLSVVVFERIGWEAADYQAWTERLLRDGTAFVVPSEHDGHPVLRFCFVNPRTSPADVALILDSLR